MRDPSQHYSFIFAIGGEHAVGLVERENYCQKEREAHSGRANSSEENVVICLSDKGSEWD